MKFAGVITFLTVVIILGNCVYAYQNTCNVIGVYKLIRLTNYSGYDDHPSFSPDGNKILFTSDRSGNLDIWVMNADGSNKTRLTISPERDEMPAWSPDGRKIAYASGPKFQRDIWIMNADGSNKTRITTDQQDEFEPEWSPDGKKIVFSKGPAYKHELWTINIDGSGLKRLTYGNDDVSSSWYPGNDILFASGRFNNDWEVFKVNENGTEITHLSHNTTGEDEVAKWSYDGKCIVFKSERSGNRDIWIMNSDGSRPMQLTKYTGHDGQPAWSPDGRKIVFNSKRGGSLDIWLMILNKTEKGLVGYWSFDEGSGNIAKDYSGFGNDGVIHGANWTEGKCGKALYFDGVDDYVEINDSESLHATNITIEMWLKSFDKSNENMMLNKFRSYVMQSRNPKIGNKRLEFFINLGETEPATWRWVTIPSNEWDANNWYHFSATYNGSEMKVYLNSKLVNSSEYNGIINVNNNNIIIGAERPNVNTFWGILDEIRIYNYARSGDEILEDMKCNASGGAREIPIPTNRSLLITNSSWRNVLAASAVPVPVIVADEIGSGVLGFIEEYEPDYIYTLGLSMERENSFGIGREDVAGLFFPNGSRRVYVDSREKGVFASALAKYMGIPLAFEKYDGFEYIDLSGNSTDEIEGLYLDALAGNNESVNYLVVANLNDSSSLLAGRIAAERGAYLIGTKLGSPEYPATIGESCDAECWNERNGAAEVKSLISDAVTGLSERGLFYTPEYYLEGGFVLLVGNVPFIIREDPVERSWFSWNDPEDGDWFFTDLDYGDLNGDGRLDISVGRFPGGIKGVSLYDARTLFFSEGRKNGKALVAAEYLHKHWPVVLLYIGGGMWQAKSIEDILSREGYNVTRLVEYRSDLDGLISELMPSGMKELLNNADSIEKRVSSFLGKSAARVAANSFVVLKALHFIEQGLEVYLEYDWSGFRPNIDGVVNTLEGYVSGGVPDNWEEIASDMIVSLFPARLPELNRSSLLGSIPGSEIVYYEGIGNGTHWILPNEYNQWDLFGSPYNGSESVRFSEIPETRSRIVWDNSGMGARNFGLEFMRKGSLSYIGSSAMVYSPYSAEIDGRFFGEEDSTGRALSEALNLFREDWFTWDPLNWMLRGDSVKAKTLREFTLLGDPGLWKDPVVGEDYVPDRIIKCDSKGRCSLTVIFRPEYRIENGSDGVAIISNSSRVLLEAGRPIIPINSFEYVLPEGSEFLGYSIKKRTRIVRNVSVPYLVPVPHGANASVKEEVDGNSLFPKRFYRVNVSEGPDNRMRVFILTALYQIAGDKTILHDRIAVTLRYRSNITVFVNASDVESGETENVSVCVANFGQANKGRVYLNVYGENFSEKRNRSAFFGKGVSCEVFGFSGLRGGKYAAEAFVSLGRTVAGPAKDYFGVGERTESGVAFAIKEGKHGKHKKWKHMYCGHKGGVKRNRAGLNGLKLPHKHVYS